MPLYYYLLFLLVIMILAFSIRSLLSRRSRVHDQLFAKGLKNENSGDFQTALINYESALIEVKKKKYNKSHLESKIIAKLKVLRTMIDYENSFQSKV